MGRPRRPEELPEEGVLRVRTSKPFPTGSVTPLPFPSSPRFRGRGSWSHTGTHRPRCRERFPFCLSETPLGAGSRGSRNLPTTRDLAKTRGPDRTPLCGRGCGATGLVCVTPVRDETVTRNRGRVCFRIELAPRPRPLPVFSPHWRFCTVFRSFPRPTRVGPVVCPPFRNVSWFPVPVDPGHTECVVKGFSDPVPEGRLLVAPISLYLILHFAPYGTGWSPR